MATNNYMKQKKARLQFLGLYAVSLVLIFIVLSAFWKKGTNPSQQTGDAGADGAFYYMQADTLLHRNLEVLDAAYTSYAAYLKSDRKGPSTGAESYSMATKTLKSSLDSINRLTMLLADGPKKQMLTYAMNSFTILLDNRNNAIEDLRSNGNTVRLPEPTPVIEEKKEKPEVKEVEDKQPEKNDNKNNAEVESLKKMLVEKENQIASIQGQMQKLSQDKDKQIASYQEQLKHKTVVTQPVNQPAQNNNASDGEWKQKYSVLKSNYDKALARESNLKTAYQTVVEDNRRLLNQLRNTKN